MALKKLSSLFLFYFCFVKHEAKLYSKNFILIALSSLLFMGSFNMIVPELPDYLRSLGGEDYLGLIISLFTLTAALSRPFSGIIADKMGRIPVMIIGTLVCVVLSALYPFVTTVFGFLLLRFLHGFSTGFKPTGTVAYIADIVPATKRGEAMGIIGLAGSIGMSLGPVTGSFIANHYGTTTMFYASSFTGLLSLLTILNLKESLPNKQKFSRSWFKAKDIFYVEKAVVPAAIVMFLYIVSFGVNLSVIPDKTVSLGFTNKGIFFGSYVFTSMLVRIFSGKSSDKYGRKIILILGLTFTAAGMFLTGLADTQTLFIVAAVTYGLAVGLTAPTIFAWTVDVASQEKRGQSMGIMYIAMEIGIFSGSLIGGQLLSFYPEYMNQIFYGGVIFALFGLIYLITLKNDRKTDS